MEPLSSESIARALAGIEFVRRIEYLPTVGSTNDVAKQFGRAGAPEATLVVADEQTAGRGRLGRNWWSPPGAAIAMSLLLRPTFSVGRAYLLTMLAGLAAAEAVEQVTRLPVALKWPNDIVLEGDAGTETQDARRKRQAANSGRQPAVAKLGGILTETSISGQQIEFAVVGVGLNVNLDLGERADLPEATSLLMELGHEVERLALLRALMERFAVRYNVIDQDARLYADWSARLTTLGRQVVAWRGEETIAGLAESVDESGALLIRTDDVTLRRVDAADVTLRDTPDSSDQDMAQPG